MTRSNSNATKPNAKPKKPHKDFPLFMHPNGQWVKKVKGKFWYFGTDSSKALKKWLDLKDDILSGRPVRQKTTDGLTVENLCNLFLESRESKVESGEITKRHFEELRKEAKVFASFFGKTTNVQQLRPSDFSRLRAKLAKGVSLRTLDNRIAKVRAVLNYADKNGLLETNLNRIWGTEFLKPSKVAIIKQKDEKPNLFTASEILLLLENAKPAMRAMILLAANAGMGNMDLGLLEFGHIQKGWLIKRRAKTAIGRRVPLWNETTLAIEKAIEARPTPDNAEDDRYVFITKYKKPWIPTAKANPISQEFSKVRRLAGIDHGSFYTLRHVCQSIGDEARDPVATRAIMGHADGSISGVYREAISDERLRAVVEHVRTWLFGGAK